MNIEDALNAELEQVLGAKHNWMGVIAGVAGRRASKFVQHGNGLLEDVVTDVSGDIIMQAKNGKLALAVIKAKEASHTDAELVENLRHVVMKATFFRVSDAMKWRHERGSTQFSQMGDGEDTISFAESIEGRSDTDADLSQYSELLQEELELMATAAEWQKKSRLAARYRRSKAMVQDRIEGSSMGELMEKFDIGSKGTMQLHLDDIGQALARLAGRLGDETLLQGTKGIEVA